ncbi:hypothetical protein [Rhodococcus marinonascens]|uniref:hypothetical protein n=1 Tax=Rhodococcus marinonascens TaxID=38311 RepID=UPI000A3F1B1E|nr:hypothetical protein [Rhodococcus marinonascens]
METVFGSPTACRELLERLAKMTDAEVQSKWSPWKDQDPPPYGPEVKKQVPAEVQLVMAEATLSGERAMQRKLWGELHDLMDSGGPIGTSTAELIVGIRVTLDHLKKRIAQFEGTASHNGNPGAWEQ